MAIPSSELLGKPIPHISACQMVLPQWAPCQSSLSSLFDPPIPISIPSSPSPSPPRPLFRFPTYSTYWCLKWFHVTVYMLLSQDIRNFLREDPHLPGSPQHPSIWLSIWHRVAAESVSVGWPTFSLPSSRRPSGFGLPPSLLCLFITPHLGSGHSVLPNCLPAFLFCHLPMKIRFFF